MTINLAVTALHIVVIYSASQGSLLFDPEVCSFLHIVNIVETHGTNLLQQTEVQIF